MKAEDGLQEKGFRLPAPPKPLANYVTAVRTGNLVFLSGHGPFREDGTLITGRVGSDLTLEQGYEASQRTVLLLLASLKATIGNLDKIRRVVKILGMVNCTADFVEQPKVINGASDLLVQVFGERGKHARSAIGVHVLPFNTPVEIEMIVEIEG
jgi:enamine deaminase RidA (YjgF/YER057c/UK114 family)